MLKGLFKTLLHLYALNLRVQTVIFLAILIRARAERTLSEEQNQAAKGKQFDRRRDAEDYTVYHTIEDGIERVTFEPKERKFDTPIIFQHGMWQGAWAWERWGPLFASWGWQSHAISLPGHAGSFKQRPLWRCTLDYYLAFLKAEVERHPVKPVIIGHSMGGALLQWYLKYVGDDLPAGILLSSMVSHSAIADGLPLLARQDPMGMFLSTITWNSKSWVRDPYYLAQKVSSPNALVKPVDLHAKLSDGSLLVSFQHNPPFWSPPENVQTPLLWLTGENDAIVTFEGQRKSAEYYGAEFMPLADTAHDIPTEPNGEQVARMIHDWLVGREIS